jgi:acyl carrier protein
VRSGYVQQVGAAIMSVAVDVESRLRALVARRLGVPEMNIGEETSLSDDLGADSLELVGLIMLIEEEFDIDVPDEDAAQIFTMKQLTEYVAFATAVKDLGRSRQIERRVLATYRHR